MNRKISPSVQPCASEISGAIPCPYGHCQKGRPVHYTVYISDSTKRLLPNNVTTSCDNRKKCVQPNECIPTLPSIVLDKVSEIIQ